MTRDYLWDKNGPPDPEVAELERLLIRFGQPTTQPAWREARAIVPPAPRSVGPFLAAAAALVLACAAALWHGAALPRPSWPVIRLAGAPRTGHAIVEEAGRLTVGEWLETDHRSRATLAVSTIGRLDVEPGTRLRIVESREGAHRLAMARGLVHAFIWAPPGEFVVETPSSRAVDLGCAYTLAVQPDGSGLIDVTAGWVAFEHAGRESFIPAGARCATRTGIGPGTPYMADAPPDLVEALTRFDFGSAAAGGHRDALARVLALARSDDVVTLWHLLSRAPADEREAVYDTLARVAPPPVVVTRQGIRAGDRAMRDAWWNALDLGDVAWWRTWKRRWP